MPYRRCARAAAADRDGDPTSFTPTRPMIIADVAASAGPAVSGPASPDVASRPAKGLAVIALVVERTLAWLARFRRLAVRYERRDDIHLAFTVLGCAVICLNQIKRFC